MQIKAVLYTRPDVSMIFGSTMGKAHKKNQILKIFSFISDEYSFRYIPVFNIAGIAGGLIIVRRNYEQ